MSSSKLIEKERLTAFERWELPNMGADQPPKQRVEDVDEAEGTPQPVTAEQIQAIQQEAHREGFEQGRNEGLKAGEAEALANARRLAQIAEGLVEPLRDLDQALEQELLQLTLAIARQVIRRELRTQPDEIIAVVREAIGQLPASAGRIRIFLHPEDSRLVREVLRLETDDERPWKLVDDPVLTRGGCRVESERSRIDASVEQRINAVIAQMLGVERASDREDD